MLLISTFSDAFFLFTIGLSILRLWEISVLSVIPVAILYLETIVWVGCSIIEHCISSGRRMWGLVRLRTSGPRPAQVIP